MLKLHQLFHDQIARRDLMMRTTLLKYLEIFIASVNYIIINFALSNMAIVFRSNLLYILFFSSELWVFTVHWANLQKLTKRKWISAVLIAGSFGIHIAMVYFVGVISGTVVPFYTGPYVQAVSP